MNAGIFMQAGRPGRDPIPLPIFIISNTTFLTEINQSELFEKFNQAGIID
jgi:hypothetical protein